MSKPRRRKQKKQVKAELKLRQFAATELSDQLAALPCAADLPRFMVDTVAGAYAPADAQLMIEGFGAAATRPVTLRANTLRATAERPVQVLEELGLRGQVPLVLLVLGRRRLMVDREHHVGGNSLDDVAQAQERARGLTQLTERRPRSVPNLIVRPRHSARRLPIVDRHELAGGAAAHRDLQRLETRAQRRIQPLARELGKLRPTHSVGNIERATGQEPFDIVRAEGIHLLIHRRLSPHRDVAD